MPLRFKKLFLWLLVAGFVASGFVFSLAAMASGDFNPATDLEINREGEPGQTVDKAYGTCTMYGMTLANTEPQQLADCMAKMMKSNTDDTKKIIKQFLRKQALEQAWDKAWEAIKQAALDVKAGAWKAMWRDFAKRLAYDTATWAASGGKGQQPLFITEGWGSYLKNTMDKSVGVFIDNIDSQFGIDLCEPDFAVKIAMKVALGERIREPRCTFSEMAKNWSSAIENPNFAFEYSSAMQQGGNDISTYLTLQSRLMDQKNWELFTESMKIASGRGFTGVENFIGQILTPGASVAELVTGLTPKEAMEADVSTFTGTIWDFIDVFINTLTGKLLDKLESGYFKGSDGSGNQGFNLSDLSLPNFSGLSSLYNSEAQPVSSGKAGAEASFKELIEGEMKVGGPYDILNKLVLCPDPAKPGPTDCVIDQILSQEIRKKTQLKDLPDSIKNRKFVPRVDEIINPQEAFTLRNVMILRKYRIVPVGWEIAAKYLDQTKNNSYKLGDLIDTTQAAGCNDEDAKAREKCELKRLIDPYWVLKAPELFCRHEGFGPISESGGVIQRDEYCADEQQCLREDASGNCSAYGYCTEEKRIWDFQGKKCAPTFNTCQTFVRDSSAISYLADTLDYRYCSASNAGCRWYSLAFNPISGDWSHANPRAICVGGNCEFDTPAEMPEENVLVPTPSTQFVEITDSLDQADWRVAPWHSISPNGRLVMASPCAKEGGCFDEFLTANCNIPKGGVKCRLQFPNDCPGVTNILSAYNGDFSACNSWNADKWTEAYQNDSNRHSCLADGGRANNGLESYTAGNSSELTTRLSEIKVAPNEAYAFSFWAKKKTGGAATGSVSVSVFFQDVYGQEVSQGVTVRLDELEADWKEFRIEKIQNSVNDKFEIRITTLPETIGTIYFDNFDLRLYDTSCQAGLEAWVYAGKADGQLAVQTEAAKDIYLDRDAAACDSTGAGCSEFIRTGSGLGSNLLANNGFEIKAAADATQPLGWAADAGLNSSIDTQTVHSGANAVKLQTTAPGCSSQPYCGHYRYEQAFKWQPNKKYALSAWVYATCSAKARMVYGSEYDANYITYKTELNGQLNQWVKLESIINTGNSAWPEAGVGDTSNSESRIDLNSDPTSTGNPNCAVYLDDVKLEEINWNDNAASDYSDYSPSARPASQLAYLKKAPSYYACYGDGAWSDNAAENRNILKTILQTRDPACANYAGVCSPEEVGCETFTPTNRDPVVPGVISSGDLCPAECVGYQVYRQNETKFVSSRYVKFIADKSPQYCSAAYAGCDEFTNLDEVAKGGEGREYYSQLRACQKPIPDGPDDAATYYTWEGSDTTGYQLKVFNLKRSQNGSLAPSAPCTTLSYPRNQGGENVCVDLLPDATDNERLLNLIREPAAQNLTPGRRFSTLDAFLKNLDAFLVALNNYGTARGYGSQVDINGDGAINAADIQLVVSGANGLASRGRLLIDELHKSGVCLKQELNGYTFFDDNGTSGDTSDDIYISLAANSDCREFYDTSGGINYRLLSQTISVSSDCHPYRRTATQDSAVTAAADCDASEGYWNEFNECLYLAVPSEGAVCPGNMAGCREYTGNKGNNVRHVFLNTFENGADVWQYGTLSAEASHPGGQSLASLSGRRASGQLARPVTIGQSKTYLLTFWAKGDSDFSLRSIRFSGTDLPENFFAADDATRNTSATPAAKITAEWRRYEFGPVFVNWGEKSSLDENLEFNLPSGKVLYLDNVLLKEVKQRVYLLADSWFTPFACDNKLNDADGTAAHAAAQETTPSDLAVCADENTAGPWRCQPGEMVGCASYKDKDNELWNLKSFERLCRVDAVGCEALIDTANSDSPLAQIEHAGDKSQIAVPADRWVYLVNNSQYSCQSADKGCLALGLPKITNREELVGFETVYLKNLPDNYEASLCKYNELWCDEFTNTNMRSVSYFKDPRRKLCEYNSDSRDWFKIGTESSEPCITDRFQTIGTGDLAEKKQPIGWYSNRTGFANEDYAGWAGLCPAEQNTCTEFVDPLSAIYTNQVFNGDFEDSYDGRTPDGWAGVSPSSYDGHTVAAAEQKIMLYAETLYALSATVSGTSALTVDCSADSEVTDVWSPDNTMVAVSTATLKKAVLERKGDGVSVSGRFYLAGGDNDECVLRVSGGKIDNVKLVPAGVYYYLADSTLSKAIDRTSCGGLVDLENGCVLFNDRSAINYNEANQYRRFSDYLTYDADQTYQENLSQRSAVSPKTSSVTGQSNSNAVIKVLPDRDCYSWLYCTTYEKTNKADTNKRLGDTDKCLDIGLCLSLSREGICGRFVYQNPDNATQMWNLSAYKEADVNKSGYSSLGKEISTGAANGTTTVAGYYPFYLMAQYGESASVGNGEFGSTYGDQGNPLGWTLVNDVDDKGWQDYKFRVGQDPNMSRSGSYLELKGPHQAESEDVDVQGNSNYVLSASVNTLDLLPSAGAQAEILIRELDDGGRPIWCYFKTACAGNSNCACLKDGWQLWKKDLLVKANLPWQQLTHTFKTASETARVRIRLVNWLDVSGRVNSLGGCDDEDLNGVCDVNGVTLFDDIDLKPALTVGKDKTVSGGRTSYTDIFVPRSCRLYPTQDAGACKYMDQSGKLYVGQYGYCLLPDPANAGNCLQWWPVDQIKGDTLDEISSDYSGRRPLYYCTKSRTQFVPVIRSFSAKGKGNFVGGTGGNTDILGMLSQSLGGFFGGSSDEVGNKQVFEFDNVDPAVRYFFRDSNVKFFVNVLSSMGGIIQMTGAGFAGSIKTALMTESLSSSFDIHLGILTNGSTIAPVIGAGGGASLSFAGAQDLVDNLVNGGTADLFGNFGADAKSMLQSAINNTLDCQNACNGTCVADGSVCQAASGCADGSVCLDRNLLDGSSQKTCKDGASCDAQCPGTLGLCVSQSPMKCFLCNQTQESLTSYLTKFEAGPFGSGGGLASITSGLFKNKQEEGSTVSIKDRIIGVFSPVLEAVKGMSNNSWSWGQLCADFGNMGGVFGFCAHVPWTAAEKLSYAAAKTPWQLMYEMTGSGLALSGYGMKIVTDQDLTYADEFSDPYPGTKGDFLGFIFIAESQLIQSMMNSGVVATVFPVEYCSEAVEVVTPSGKNKALNSRMKPGSGYTLQNNEVKGETMMESIVDSISGGLGGFFSSLTKTESSAVLNNIFSKLQSKWPALSGLIFEKEIDYNTDYQPFGALVPPADSVQYPPQWDSREGAIGRQPLFDEEPDLTYPAPYQARAGATHTIGNVKELFVRSYGLWRWNGNYSSGSYSRVDGESDNLSNNLIEFIVMNAAKSRAIRDWQNNVRIYFDGVASMVDGWFSNQDHTALIEMLGLKKTDFTDNTSGTGLINVMSASLNRWLSGARDTRSVSAMITDALEGITEDDAVLDRATDSVNDWLNQSDRNGGDLREGIRNALAGVPTDNGVIDRIVSEINNWLDNVNADRWNLRDAIYDSASSFSTDHLDVLFELVFSYASENIPFATTGWEGLSSWSDWGAGEGAIWHEPERLCVGNTRTTLSQCQQQLGTRNCTRTAYQAASYCYIQPLVSNILFDSAPTAVITGNAPVKLNFNIKVDDDQLPLVAYKVEWGDGKADSVSGVSLRNRTQPEYPFELYHHYDYWQLTRANSKPENSYIFCGDAKEAAACVAGARSLVPAGECWVKVRITATDNWGKEGATLSEGCVKVKKE